MNFTVLTLFPELLESFFSHGMIGRALGKKLISASCVNIRHFAEDRHNTVDDRPYGGGCGMVMKPEPLAGALGHAIKGSPDSKVVLMTPQGRPFDQYKAWEMASEEQGLIFVCGRYEGIDERICHSLVHEEISIGDYVMTGGELAAMVIIDAVTRLIPGVLGGAESAEIDSFKNNRLEHAQYTRPPIFEEMKVPDVLLSGNHKRVAKWRQRSSLERTFLKRRDLFNATPLSLEEKEIMKQWCRELEALVKG